MNIALPLRNVGPRLYVAYMAHAYYGGRGFAKCEPGNTATRAYEYFANDAKHSQYRSMWNTIGTFYENTKLYELSESEIIDMFNTWRGTGFTDANGKQCTGIDLMSAKQQWADNNWTRYEQRRNGRRTAARMTALPVLACFGIVLPGE